MKFNKSFLKWPGGKYRLLDKLIPLFQIRNKPHIKFIEPFAGSGVVFLNANFSRFIIADCNTVDVFQNLELYGEKFIEEILALFKDGNNSERYYELRDEFNNLTHGFKKSILLIYLNRHCFNGLFRLNKKGKFNVPFGKYKTIYFPELELKNFYKKLMENQVDMYPDYKLAMSRANMGDVVYCDPPYVPINKSGFTNYSGDGFSKEDQEELAIFAIEACKKGAAVIISNHDIEFIRQLYSDAYIIEVDVRRSISAKSGGRKEVKEIIAIFPPKIY